MRAKLPILRNRLGSGTAQAPSVQVPEAAPMVAESAAGGGALYPAGTDADRTLSFWQNSSRIAHIDKSAGAEAYGALQIDQFQYGEVMGIEYPVDSMLLPNTGVTGYAAWLELAELAHNSDIFSLLKRGGSSLLFRVASDGTLELYIYENTAGTMRTALSGGALSPGAEKLGVAVVDRINDVAEIWVGATKVASSPIAATIPSLPTRGIMLGFRSTSDDSSQFVGDIARPIIFRTDSADAKNDLIASLSAGGPSKNVADYTEAEQNSFLSFHEMNSPRFEGAWTWRNDPRAAFDGEATFLGYITPAGDVRAASYNHSTGTWAVSADLDTVAVDDHANPAFLPLPDGTTLAFWAGHNEDLKMAATDAIGSAATFGATSTIEAGDCSYAQPVQFPDGTIRLFFRQYERDANGGIINGARFYVDSVDGGDTWSSSQKVISNPPERPYLALAQTAGILHFLFTDEHPNRDGLTKLYHCYYSHANGSYYQSDGTLIGTAADLPLAPSDATLIWDSQAQGEEARVWDAVVVDGKPAVAFVTFPTTNDHRYHVGRWTGASWETSEVCTAGSSIVGSQQPYYSGGVVLISDTEVVASREVSNGRWELERYSTSDFANWISEPITANTPEDTGAEYTGEKLINVRPFVDHTAAGLDAPLSLLWLRGTYDGYTEWRLDVMGGKAKPDVH